jgi:hypothetical protein
MERDGLVRREADAADGRVVWLHATAKGARLLHAGRRRRVAALEADLAGLPPAERDTLAAATAILERVLGDTRTADSTDGTGRKGGRGRMGRSHGTGKMGGRVGFK